MKASGLADNYRRAVSSPQSMSSKDVGNGIPFILGQSEWVRILFIRGIDGANDSIQVEVSVPERIGGQSSTQDEDLVQTQLADMISAVIDHMQYLSRLHQAGFILDVMEEEFLWTATLDTTMEPDEHLFDILIPP
ncbi:MAG: hypothetical protein ACFFEA_08000 [Candidatus Thorarchaeota archaeon]